MHHLFIVWVSAGVIEWQSSCIATILLLYELPKVISVIVLFVAFEGFFSSLLYR